MSPRSTARRKSTRRATRKTSTPDAIALLKADHRQVEDWIEQFEKARLDSRKTELAAKICNALTVHTRIEEEIFYPAFFEATQDKEIHHEAIVEHDGAKNLIQEIEASGPEDDYFDAKVKVLSEMIKHHVKEEEQRGGMFAQARQSDLDLEALGQRLQARKDELMDEAGKGERERAVNVTLSRVARHGSA
jgi:hemerythrin superfamily protein